MQTLENKFIAQSALSVISKRTLSCSFLSMFVSRTGRR